MAWKNIIGQAEAKGLLESGTAKFVDASWYLPAQNRNAAEEFATARIPGAVFFDIDAISDTSSDLPHMLPTPEKFAAAVGAMGITETDQIVIYDGPGVFSAPRVWWTFRSMGAQNVKVLEGGMDGWKANNFPVETGSPEQKTAANFSATFSAQNVASQSDLIANLESQSATVLDARPYERYLGEAPEPRPGLRSGHIPGSLSVPSSSLVEAGALVPIEALNDIFKKLGLERNDAIITSCGSGITAAIIALALDEAGFHAVRLFDGSWAQWGMPDGPAIATGK